MSRTTLKSSVSSTFPDNSIGTITPSNHRSFLDTFIDETLLSEDVMSENQNGSILLTNKGRGLWYGTDAAKTGAITVDLTGAITGAVAWVIHNDATEPTITGATKSNFTYNTGQNNYIKIIAQKVGGTSIALASTPFAGNSTSITVGAGSPESVVTANKGALYLRTDGEQDQTVYEKASGTGNTGWLSEAEKGSFIELTDGATITWYVRNSDSSGRKKAYVTLAGNRTLAEPKNYDGSTETKVNDGDELTLLIYQDATGYRTLAWPSNFEFKGTSEIRNDPSGYDILKAVYDATADKFYCWFPIERGYREYMIYPAASNINLDMDALTTRQKLDYDGKTIFLNNSNSTGGGSLVELPDTSSLPIGYRLPIKMQQNSNGADLEVRVSGIDIMYISAFDNEAAILDTGTPNNLKLVSGIDAWFECNLVVRNGLSGSVYKVWGIEYPKYVQQKFAPYAISTGTSVIARKTHGHKIKMTVTGNFTLAIPTGYAIGEDIEIIIVQDGTGRTVGVGSGWKTVGGSWVSSTANTISRIRATFQGSSEWYATIENNITTPV